MTAVILYNAPMMTLLWLGAAVAGLAIYGGRMRQKGLQRFADPGMLERLSGKQSVGRGSFKGGCVCMAVVLMVLALCRPAWHAKEVELTHSGRDIMFVMDVSRSMFAQDLPPNRLERAKRAIMDCTEALGGDRVGLVVFAGSASITCPLTRDIQFFRTALRSISWDSAQIGGTRIGDAIQKTAKHLLTKQRSGYQDIILITDGEDHESRPEAAATILKTGGIRLIAVGIGDAYQGQRIQVEEEETGTTGFLTYQGQEVWTRLNAPLLRRIVDVAGQGVFWEAGTGVIDLKGLYRQEIATAQQINTDKETVLVYEEQFQWFLAGALVLLLLRRGTAFWRGVTARAMVIALVCGVVMQDARAAENEGLRAYDEGRFGEAVSAFQQILDRDGPSPRRLYNLGTSLYKHGEYEKAFDAFDAATLAETNPELRWRCVYNKGNCLFRMAEAMAVRGPAGLAMDKDGLVAMRDLYTRSNRVFRAVLKTRPDSDKAAFNLELVKIRMGEVCRALEVAQAAEQLAAKQMVSLRKKLAELVTQQEQLADDTADIIDWQTQYDIPRIIARQRLILTETDKVKTVMEQLKGNMPKRPDDDTPTHADKTSALQASLAQILKAIMAEGSALKDLPEKRLDDGNENQYAAVDALTMALELFPDVDTPEGQQDKAPESEWTGRTEEGDAPNEGQVFELAAGEVDTVSLPAPNLSPEAILREEVTNRRQRQRKRSEQYGNVERNW
jgi:Ca-activated chloride channel homolog